MLEQIGVNAVAGRILTEDSDIHDPVTFSEMRRSAWDIHSRVADMDIDGVYASVCFPSFVAGFGGVRLQTTSADLDLSLALVRAWNDWHLEEWVGSYPERMIPCQLPWLHDPVLGAREIEKNAERGFKAVTFPESPHQAGFPSIHSGYWDPLVESCAETDTTICIHTGSAGKLPEGEPDGPPAVRSALFGAGYSLMTTVDWLYSKYPATLPSLKIVITEGGVGWVPSLLDRLDHDFRQPGNRLKGWAHDELKPSDVLKRAFWFCLLDEPSALMQRDRIGVDNILYETDFPHEDTSWPNTQRLLSEHFRGRQIGPYDVDRITWSNASTVFRHPVPEEIQRNPNAY